MKNATSRSVAAIWQPCTQMQRAVAVPPLAMVRGDGPVAHRRSQPALLRCHEFLGGNIFGHAGARINAALGDQLDTLPHVMLRRLHSRTGDRAGRAPGGAERQRAGTLFLCQRWRFDGRGRVEDGFSPPAQQRTRCQARVHLPATWPTTASRSARGPHRCGRVSRRLRPAADARAPGWIGAALTQWP